MNVRELTVEAALTGKKEHILRRDARHTAAELTAKVIYLLVDDLIEAHGDVLPEYK